MKEEEHSDLFDLSEAYTGDALATIQETTSHISQRHQDQPSVQILRRGGILVYILHRRIASCDHEYGSVTIAIELVGIRV